MSSKSHNVVRISMPACRAHMNSKDNFQVEPITGWDNFGLVVASCRKDFIISFIGRTEPSDP